MTKLKCIAVDDEPLALDIIEDYVSKVPFLELVKRTENAIEALQMVQAGGIDLVFLDIQMPENDGVSFYKSLQNKPLVIFTTAFDSYAVEGFNVNAVDYLLKPIAYERFETAVEKVKKLKQLPVTATEDPFILIRADYKLNKIYLKNILFIEGLDDYIQIHIEGKTKIVARMSMKNIMEQLPALDFIRIHRSFIIPVQRITSVQSKFIFINEQEFSVGDTYKTTVLQLLTDKKI